MKPQPPIGEALVTISDTLTEALASVTPRPPVTHVYNPLIYARGPHTDYLRRYGRQGIEALFLGMNPGPWGMAQTGVPFGEIGAARDWLGVGGAVTKPEDEHPKRPIVGFDCPRSEVSGRRLWSWARERFQSPEAFFDRFFVANYCPLVFMEASGRNWTPDKLPAAERGAIYDPCDEALRATVQLLRPARVVGVGAFAEKRAQEALRALPDPPEIGRILHPSPASPLANRGWAERAEKELRDMGVQLG